MKNKKSDITNKRVNRKRVCENCHGIEKWYSLKKFVLDEDIRQELRRLARSYMSYQKLKINLEQALDLENEKMMPGIKKIITDDDKLFDFIESFYHYDTISKLS